MAFVKGAPDVVLDLCREIRLGGQAVALTDERKSEVLEQNRDLASHALRVLAVAYRPLGAVPEQPTPETLEKELIFVGLLGMIDPARPEVIEAVRVANRAGLKSVMVTGDHKETAEAIAREIGILTPGGSVLTGPEIERLSDAELAAKAETLQVCCRVSPQHKTRIVDAMKANGHVAAMTGDGVNDAPALKRANIGVAMGITGTDVSKQTADMVLTDDNFASIVAAIEQGRIIYSNIRKFVYFLLACNVGEILIIFGAMLFGMPIPLRPVHLLWLNLVSDGAPALALGMEKGDKDIMQHPPRPPKEPVINRDMAIGIGVIALVDALAILTVFYFALQRYPEPPRGRADDRVRDAVRVRAGARVHRTLGVPLDLLDRRVLQQVDGVGGRCVAAARAGGGVRAVPAALLRHRAAHARRLADDGAVLRRLARSPWSCSSSTSEAARRRASRSAPPRPFPPEASGGNPMRVLVPVDGSRNCEFAVRHVIRQFMNNTDMEVHILNVQPPLTSYITRFLSRRNVRDYHADEAAKALRPVRQLLDGFGIPYAVHIEIGERAECITAVAHRLRCDHIVMSTARKNSLTRLVENSTTNRVLELTAVPVELIPGDSVSRWERYGIPAGLTTLLALIARRGGGLSRYSTSLKR